MFGSVHPSVRLCGCLRSNFFTRSGRYLGSACRVQQKHHDTWKISGRGLLFCHMKTIKFLKNGRFATFHFSFVLFLEFGRLGGWLVM